MSRAIVAFLLLVNGVAAAIAQPAPTKQNAPKPTPAKQAAPKALATPADDRKCIGVVSQLGETFTVKKVGVVVFQNEESKVPIESWRIDDLVVAKIGGFLGKRAAVRRVARFSTAVSQLRSGSRSDRPQRGGRHAMPSLCRRHPKRQCLW
jgi:hypothetical protein